MVLNLDATELSIDTVVPTEYATYTVRETLKQVYSEMPSELEITIKGKMGKMAEGWVNAVKLTPITEKLRTLAEQKGDDVTAGQISEHLTLDERRKKILKSEQMADLLGAELLKRYGEYPELAGEPLIIRGADYIIKKAQEQLDFEREVMRTGPEMPTDLREYSEEIHGDIEQGIKDLEIFSAKIKERQVPQPL